MLLFLSIPRNMYGQMTNFTNDIHTQWIICNNFFSFLPCELIAGQKVTHLVYDLNHATAYIMM